MVVHQLDGDVAFGQQANVVVEFTGGDGAGTGLFDFGGAAGAQRLVEVCGGDGEAAGAFGAFRRLGGFKEEVRQDGDRCFALHDGLCGREFAQQLGARYRDFQVANGCCGFGHHGCGGHDSFSLAMRGF